MSTALGSTGHRVDAPAKPRRRSLLIPAIVFLIGLITVITVVGIVVGQALQAAL